VKETHLNLYECLFGQHISFISSPTSDILDVMLPAILSTRRKDKLLLITTFNETALKAIVKRYGLTLSPSTEKILSLREDFIDFKDKYGIETVIEEISDIVKKENIRNVMIHNFNAWFSDKDIPFIDRYVKLFSEYASKLEISFSFWFIENSPIGEKLRSALELLSLFGIEAVKQERIFTSFFLRPVKSVYPECVSTYKVSIGDKVVLEPLESLTYRPKLLIGSTSEGKRIADMLEFVFSKKADVFQLESSADAVNCTLETPDCFIVISDKNNLLRIKDSMKLSVKEQKRMETVYVFISLSPLRSTDRVELLKSGIALLFSYPFSLDEFVAVMEKTLRVNFSSDLHHELLIQQNFVSSKEEIEKIAVELCKKRKLFSIIGGISSTPFSEKTLSFRGYDRVYYDERTGETILFLYDVWKDFAPKVVEDRGIKMEIDTLLDTLDVKELLGIEG